MSFLSKAWLIKSQLETGCVCSIIKYRGLVHKFMHGWDPADLPCLGPTGARPAGSGRVGGEGTREVGHPALPTGGTPNQEDNLHSKILFIYLFILLKKCW